MPLKIFDGENTKNLEFEIAAVLDESKIGNNGDKIDMLLLPVDSMQKIAHSNLTYQYVICVEDSLEQQTILDKGIMPSEKVLDFPVDCNTLTGSVNL